MKSEGGKFQPCVADAPKSKNALIIERFQKWKAFEWERKSSYLHLFFFTFIMGFLSFACYLERPGILATAILPGLFVPVALRSYFRYFGVDEVKWMAVNGALSIFAMYSDVNSLLYRFGVSMSDYHWYVHITPFTYIVMFTFLPRQVLLEIAHAREDELRKERVSRRYAWGTFAFHTVLLIWGRASGPG